MVEASLVAQKPTRGQAHLTALKYGAFEKYATRSLVFFFTIEKGAKERDFQSLAITTSIVDFAREREREMGVSGHFWDLLKPYAKNEGPDFLRDKRVAVDLSYWIVQQETAVKTHIRNPHIRLTFFRTINLFAKFGAFPVFVVDGTPSPLKSQARIAWFFRLSGIESLSLVVAEEGVSVERNGAFQKCVKEGVELLELLGMPVLKARGEAEALCAQLNREGQVHACITADSDSFLFGAECTIKHIRPNCK
ncbi:hypothetical protein RJ639_011593, partial [Escallonia herrerae]